MTSRLTPTTIDDVREIFTKAFPAFFDRPRLLEIGEGVKLAATARAAGVHPDLFERFMLSLTRSPEYLEATRERGAWRYKLDGTKARQVTDEEGSWAGRYKKGKLP